MDCGPLSSGWSTSRRCGPRADAELDRVRAELVAVRAELAVARLRSLAPDDLRALLADALAGAPQR
jgi:hypothetical protein